MSNLVRLGLAARNARATAIRDLLDAGSGPGKLLCYAGTVPATGAAITTQTLLGTATLSDPCGTVSAGTLTFSAITGDSSADATGTVTFVRALDSANNFVADLDAGVTGSGQAVIFNSTSIITGGAINVLSAQIVEA